MPSPSSSPARLEAFSDGVIAVIITIMVLELKVPHEDGIAGIGSFLPTLLVYALSFSVTGVYWINHRHLIDCIEGRLDRIAESILYANLFLLFCLSLLPFFTAYVLAKHLDSFSVALYGASNIVSGLSFMILRLTILRIASSSSDASATVGYRPSPARYRSPQKLSISSLSRSPTSTPTSPLVSWHAVSLALGCSPPSAPSPCTGTRHPAIRTLPFTLRKPARPPLQKKRERPRRPLSHDFIR